MKEWFTPKEMAGLGLPDVPGTDRAIQLIADRHAWRRPELEFPGNPQGVWRKRAGRGGGYEYRAAVLPLRAQTALALRQRRDDEAAQPRVAAKAEICRDGLWRAYDALPDKKKAEAQRRLDALLAVGDLERGGSKRDTAMMFVANQANVSLRTLYGWAQLVQGRPRADWIVHLAPKHAGRTVTVECPADAWEVLKADYLRPERPSFADCYRRLQRLAGERGWTLPAERTLERRMNDMPEALRVLARNGAEALKRLYPAQERDRSCFHALEAVNADGHKFDVFVQWPDGSVSRPILVGFQDLFSGMVLAWRLDRTECKEAVLLAFGDLVETWGIPDHCWLDNGRNFASKWLTGGTPNRYRFKVREDEPAGVMTTLGVEVHWTQPYSGQSKPIERAWRDFAGSISKDPRLAGAWTGNTVDAKPENYGSKAIPIALFERVVAEGIAEHNARLGRRSKICAGRLSFEQVFLASYERAPIKRATAEQRRLWLLAAEGVSIRTDASIHLLGNRYWSESLLDLIGTKIIARFDPEALHEGLHVYRLDGSYVTHAPCIEAAGFSSRDRHSHYHVKGQAERAGGARAKRAPLDAKLPPLLQALQIPEGPSKEEGGVTLAGLALDPEIARWRPCVSMTRTQATAKSAQTQADWMKRTRRAKGDKLDYLVRDYRGIITRELWRPNTLSFVDDSFQVVRRDMLIAGVSFLYDERGEQTRLRLTGPEAYDMEADGDRRQNRGGGRSRGRSGGASGGGLDSAASSL